MIFPESAGFDPDPCGRSFLVVHSITQSFDRSKDSKDRFSKPKANIKQINSAAVMVAEGVWYQPLPEIPKYSRSKRASIGM